MVWVSSRTRRDSSRVFGTPPTTQRVTEAHPRAEADQPGSLGRRRLLNTDIRVARRRATARVRSPTGPAAAVSSSPRVWGATDHVLRACVPALQPTATHRALDLRRPEATGCSRAAGAGWPTDHPQARRPT
jgi:hypothetical protein